MKKLKIMNSAIALLSIPIVLFSGCTKNKDKKETKKPETCIHLTVQFGNDSVTFKECEGYHIIYMHGDRSGTLYYSVSKDGETVVDNGYASQYNLFRANHDFDECVSVEAFQKTKR